MSDLTNRVTGNDSLVRLANKANRSVSYKKVGFNESLMGYAAINSVSSEISDFIKSEFKTVFLKKDKPNN